LIFFALIFDLIAPPIIALIFDLIAGMVAGLIARGAGRGALAGFVAGIIGAIVVSLIFAPFVITGRAGFGWISYAFGLMPIASLFGGIIGGAARPRTPKQSTGAELTPGPQFSARPTTEMRTPRECRTCHNINPPYAMNYCVKCGTKLETL
jgi:uncharacterized membrane protein YeaQ/YmgE (transglycosylase-associated protein family)